MKDYVIETRRLTKAYRSFKALDQVSIHVKRGEIYGLIGDNGAGKTTLLKALTGLITPAGGEIALFGKTNEKELSLCRKRMGVMIEEPGFFSNLSVEKNVEYFRILKGVPGPQKTDEILSLVGLWEKRKSKGAELSMGMKQRLGLALAMIGEPQILILDEPINGLDPSGIIEFRSLLLRLNEEKGITILLSSHILSELQQTASTFGFLNKGKLLEEVSVQELTERCADYLEIAVSDIEAYVALLDRHFPDEDYRILPDCTIQLSAPLREEAEYSRLAAAHDILITGLRRRRYSLENYYMNLKGGRRHA